MVNGNGAGFEIGAGLKISNPAIGIGGLVLIGAIGAHLISGIFAKNRVMTVEHKTSLPSIHEAMFGEVRAMATDPTMVDRNADRVNEALKQRRDYIKTLREKVKNGQISHQQFASAIQQHSSDVLDQLGMPQNPHPSSFHQDGVNWFKQHRISQLQKDFAAPGGLLLDPEEQAYVEHQLLSYPAETNRFALKEAVKKQAENARLTLLRQKRREHQLAMQQALIQRDSAQDALVQNIHERERAGVSQ